jgi:hypothetical protein
MSKILYKGISYEAAEQWMNLSEIEDSLDTNDFTMGFECELVVPLRNNEFVAPNQDPDENFDEIRY